MKGKFVFSKKQLDKLAVTSPPTYCIGTDTYDKRALTYCFVKQHDGVSEILLCKSMKNKTKFWQEVNNLSEYFNATVIKGVD